MNKPQEPVSVDDNAYIVFMSRVIGLWLILAFITLWLMGQLPYQLPVEKTAWLQSLLIGELATIVPTTLTILFMIIPSRKLAVVCLFAMIFLIISYHGRNPALKLSILPLIYLPFIVKKTEFRNAWKWISRLMFLSFVFTAPLLSLSYTAIPVYSLLLSPFLPWERWFIRFNERFEPK